MSYATLVLLNGRVYTLNYRKPTAQAVAVSDEKIVYVGEDSKASKLVGSKTKVVDLDGRTVLPGFTDCHVHVASFGRSLSAPNLRNVTSITQLKNIVTERSR